MAGVRPFHSHHHFSSGLKCPWAWWRRYKATKPSATAEKHYTVRPLELLALHHEKIEAWILEQAGIEFDAAVETGKLRVVAG